MTGMELTIALMEIDADLDVDVNVQDSDSQWQNEVASVEYNQDQNRIIIRLGRE